MTCTCRKGAVCPKCLGLYVHTRVEDVADHMRLIEAKG